jgi:hypothetical protein
MIPNAMDARCLFEAELEKLRREYNLTSQKTRVAKQAEVLINAYFTCPKMRTSALANWRRK